MSESLYSPSWYRIAELRPRLRSHAQLHRHFYRGELWYIMQDHSSGRYHRFTPSAYRLIGLMDGRRTIQEIWEIARSYEDDEPPTQEEVIRLLSQLHSVDMLQCNVPPDTAELLDRFEKQQKSRLKMRIGSPFAVRIPLLDPDRFLNKVSPFTNLFFSWFGFLVWIFFIGAAIALGSMHWPALTEDITDRILAPRNLALMWVTFPFIKALHEFGHACAVKSWGGEVHEMGIMFLVFTPIPYMDASSASAFRERRRRVIVGSAGIMVELFIASLALFIWSNAEPGTLRAICYNIVLIASVSTLLFNGNPLLRYDGYYILSDFLEIPNLGPRGNNYLGYLFQRYLLRIEKLTPPVATAGERVWFCLFSISAFIYRAFVYTAIILFVAGKFFVIGVLLALWGGLSMLVLPLGKGISFLLTDTALRKRRWQAFAMVFSFLALTVAAFIYMPFPLRTMTEGVIWIPEKSIVYAGTDGFVGQFKSTPGKTVGKGDLLMECYDPLLPAEVRVLESQLQELQAKYDVQKISELVESEITLEEMKTVRGKLDRARERLSELDIKSAKSGIFIVPGAEDLPGKFVKQGEMVAYVVEPADVTVRLVVPQSDVDLVRQRSRDVLVRFADNIDTVVPARIIREVPGATTKLPSSALGSGGGGDVAVDPRDTQGKTAFQNVFEFEVRLLKDLPHKTYGGRVFVRFDHGFEPLAFQCYRALRRMFLKRFSV